jgi:hypothetical protein
MNPMTSSGASPERSLEELTAEVARLATISRDIYNTFQPLSFDQMVDNLPALAFRVSVLRQVEALEAGVALTRDRLGHLSVMFVRPACDEYFWLKYLTVIEDEPLRKLLGLLSQVEGLTSVLTQQQYAGKKDMKYLGFPAAFVNQSIRARAATVDQLTTLGVELGWPQRHDLSASAVPSTHWVANKAGGGKLYDFLYSASSRMLHFSMGEVARRGWADSPTGAIDLASPSYTVYRAHFGLYWAVHLLILTLPLGSKLGEDLDKKIVSMDSYLEVVRRIAAFGKVPITTPAEFNLRND